jgi:serine/threonine protein phosphatase 1
MFEHVLGESYTGVYNWFPNGGGWSEEVDPDELATMVKFAYQTMSLAIETQRGDRRIGFVHASPPNEWTERAIAGWPTHVCWDREIIRYGQPVGECVPEGIDRLYMGHTPVKQPVSRDGCTWLDTGAFATGILTILEI